MFYNFGPRFLLPNDNVMKLIFFGIAAIVKKITNVAFTIKY